MANYHFVAHARKDNAVVKKGEPYYWWKFRYGGIHMSATRPTRSQLTNSSFLQEVYAIEERIEKLTVDDDLETELDDIKSLVEDLYSQCEDSLSNMPEQLQESSVLNERIEALDQWRSELESVDVDIDEDDLRSQAEGEFDEDDEDFDDLVEDRLKDLIDERKSDILSDIQNCMSGL